MPACTWITRPGLSVSLRHGDFAPTSRPSIADIGSVGLFDEDPTVLIVALDPAGVRQHPNSRDDIDATSLDQYANGCAREPLGLRIEQADDRLVDRLIPLIRQLIERER